MSAPELLTLRPGCKVNLFLRILTRREDGYHELETLFLFLPEPSDVLTITPVSGDNLRFSCSAPELGGDSNLVVRAWRLFAEASGFSPGLDVHLEKRAPVGAGVGGGSADGAAMLLALEDMARATGKSVGMEKLSELALELGADVPFFLRRTPCLATGVGEQLQEKPEALDWLKGLTLVLCTPRLHVSTAWAYRAWDEANGFLPEAPADGQEPRSGENPRPAGACGTIRGLTDPNSVGIGAFCLGGLVLFNSFEAVVFRAHGSLRMLAEELLRFGAAGSLLSGSGSSLFGIFRDARQALAAQKRLRALGASAHMHSF